MSRTATSDAPPCPLPINAALLQVQAEYAIWFDPRGLAMMYGSLLVLLGSFAWLFESWRVFVLVPILAALHAVILLATRDDRFRARRRRRERTDWGTPVKYAFPDLGGYPVVLFGAVLCFVAAYYGLQAGLSGRVSPLWLSAVAAVGPGIWFARQLARATDTKLRLGRLPWALGQRRQVRLRLLDRALAFEGVTAWVRVLESTKPGQAELLHEECVVHEPERRMAVADEFEFVVPVRPGLPVCRLTRGRVVWWELVVVGRRHGGGIHWIYLLPVQEPVAQGETS